MLKSQEAFFHDKGIFYVQLPKFNSIMRSSPGFRLEEDVLLHVKNTGI